MAKYGILVGIAGEYYVAAELSRMGYIASLTLKNTKGIDILVSNETSLKTIVIQVRTSRKRAKQWILSKKCEEYYGENLFYVFLNLNEIGVRPDFHIVPSKIVSDYIKETHKNWR